MYLGKGCTIMTKNEILTRALELNGDDKKYQITVEDDKIITRVKWMDATFFAPDCVTDEVKTFEYIVKIHDNGKYSEVSKKSETTKKLSGGGFGYSKKGFVGKEFTFSKTVGVGENHLDGTAGVISTTFNSEEYKKPVRNLLASCGAKKKMGTTGKFVIAASILAVLLIIAAIVLILNVSDKVAIDAETFRAKAEESGYYVANDSFMESRYDEIESVIIAVDKNSKYQIEFYVLSNAEIAEELYLTNKQTFEDEDYKSKSNVDSKKYNSCTFNTNSSYRYISRVGNTMLYVDADKEYKNEIKAFIEKIGY